MHREDETERNHRVSVKQLQKIKMRNEGERAGGKGGKDDKFGTNIGQIKSGRVQKTSCCI